MGEVTQGVAEQDKDNVRSGVSEEFGDVKLVSLVFMKVKRALVFFHGNFGFSFFGCLEEKKQSKFWYGLSFE